jgi:hypothetical protein
MRSRLFGLVAILCGVLAVVVAVPLTAAAGQPSPQHPTFDDSRLPHTFRAGGDPTVGVRSSANGSSGYYYLNVSVGSNGTVNAAIWTNSGQWRIDWDSGFNKTPLKRDVWQTTPAEDHLSGLRPGQFIRVRFANESGRTSTDHGSAYSVDSCELVGQPNETSRAPADAPCGPDPTAGSATSSSSSNSSSSSSSSGSAPVVPKVAPTPVPGTGGKSAGCGSTATTNG